MGAPFALGIGRTHLSRACGQHVVPPQPPQLFSIRVSGSPPKPPSRGLPCSLLPFAVRHINNHIDNQAMLRWIGVGCGPSRPVPATRRKACVFHQTPRTCREQTREGRAGQEGKAEKGRAGQRAASPQPPYTGGLYPPHRSDGTLGRGPRSEPRAPMQMSAALSAV